MSNFTNYLQESRVKRPHVVQVRLSDEDKKLLEEIARQYDAHTSRVLYELFRYALMEYKADVWGDY